MPPQNFESVAEVAHYGSAPSCVHPGWVERFPWLIQATTHKGEAGFDLRFFGEERAAGAERRMAVLATDLGFSRQVLSHQVHEARVLPHADCGAGLSIADDADGHLTQESDLLLAVTVADCVPIFVVDPTSRAIALLHAGWRSAAAGILEIGLSGLASTHGVRAPDVFVHLGPSICGKCYEVGPEVFRALNEPEPDRAKPLDLRAVLARRAVDSGVDPRNVSISALCTRCGATPFYSHRGGDTGRQLALLGIRNGGVSGAAGGHTT